MLKPRKLNNEEVETIARAYLSIGTQYLKSGKYKECLIWYKKAYLLKPELTYNSLAYCYIQFGASTIPLRDLWPSAYKKALEYWEKHLSYAKKQYINNEGKYRFSQIAVYSIAKKHIKHLNPYLQDNKFQLVKDAIKLGITLNQEE